MSRQPDHDSLFQLASSQAGYFTVRQARECGFDRRLLSYHVKAGNYVRVHHGVYRLTRYPSSPYEEVVAAWLAAGPDKAVVSHESALQIHGLSDVVPQAIHMTVPRGARGGRQPRPSAVKIHTTTRRFESGEVQEREGMRVSAPARAIVDAAHSGTAPDQVLLAIREALERALVSERELVEAARGRTARVRELVLRGIEEAEAR
jgi:predicted transcriptional regulator of viral defense system